MNRKDARENAAANAVVKQFSALTGIPMQGQKWDDGTANGMHDFYVEGGSHRIALEVTTIADRERVGRDHRWDRLAPGGWIEVEGLTSCWLAFHEGKTEASAVISTIQSRVPELESLGLPSVDAYLWQKHAFSPVVARPPGCDQSRALHEVGIMTVSRVADASDELLANYGGHVQVVRGFGTIRQADRNLPATFVTQQLRGDHSSDVLKLRAVGDATARHIWMWVEPEEGLPMSQSFKEEGLPSDDLDVDGIDGVWLGRAPAAAIITGHLWLRGQGWSTFSVARNETALE